MQYPIQIKGTHKKSYPTSSANSFTNKFQYIPEVNQNNKFCKFRRTDHTDDKNSDASVSRVQPRFSQVENGRLEEASDGYGGEGHGYHTRKHSGENLFKMLSEKYQKAIQLHERLKNIHHFYRIRIQQQRTKNIERNQIFIGIIQQLQKSHNDKIQQYQKSLQQMQQDKKQMGFADQRMNNLQNQIEDVLKKSQDLKITNEKLQKQILNKELVLKEKQQEFITKKQEMDIMRQKLEQFERLRLKENKRTREVLEMIENIL